MSQEAAQGQALDGGNYEIIRKRLVEHGRALQRKADALNQRRKETFGSSQMELLGTVKVRTENKCVPRDLVSVGGHLLFGYNVFTGMKTTEVGDVFACYDLLEDGSGFDFRAFEPGFLRDPQFLKLFSDLYQYNRSARLMQLRAVDGKLLAVFQTGSSMTDVRVMRWALEGGAVRFLDDRGDRDNALPPSHDFAWRDTTRDQHVYGDHPHISIKNKVFVECVGGDLTLKVEDNTSSGQGIYAEPVEDKYQSLSDADIAWAEVGPLILLKVRPYREERHRYLVFNGLTQAVLRLDAIGASCVQLPEGHGLIFPGGYYLASGETKVFTEDVKGLEFYRAVRSPNGEDVLYIFHRKEDGHYILLPYNLIRKEIQSAILCHGYSLFDDGRLVVFRFDGDEPAQVHPMQVWRTSFVSDLVAAQATSDGSFLSKVGNAELVRGLSEFYTIHRAIENQQPTLAGYEELIAQARRCIDAYHWLGHADVGNVLETLREVHATADLIVDEFEKVIALRRVAAEGLEKARASQADIFSRSAPDDWAAVGDFVRGLGELRQHRGRLIGLKEVRYADLDAVNALEAATLAQGERVSRGAVAFLLKGDALKPYHADLTALTAQIERAAKVIECDELQKKLDEMSQGLDLLTEVVGGLKVDDATARTQILEGISEVFALLNRTKALLAARRKELRSKEGVAEFGAQFKLFGQSVTNALGLVDTPEKCDEQLSRLMVQMEELEGRFGEFDEFLGELATKRDEVYQAFEARKQGLLEARQRRASNLMQAAERILQGVGRRAQGFQEDEALHSYFASDPMILKARELAVQLRELGDAVKADDLEAKLKSARDQAVRALRDRKDIYEDGASVVRFGKHRFSANAQALELTMLPRDEGMFLHLTGTEYFERLEDEALDALRPWWSQALVSETDEVYRGEYLASCVLRDADEGRAGLSLAALTDAARTEGGLLALVRAYAAERYEEGYDRGIHDADGARILEKLLHLRATGGLLRFAPGPRALGCLFWAFDVDEAQHRAWGLRARSLGRLREAFGHTDGLRALAQELARAVEGFVARYGLDEPEAHVALAGSYLAEELCAERPRFVTSAESQAVCEQFWGYLEGVGLRRAFEDDLAALESDLAARRVLVGAWLEGFVSRAEPAKVAALRLTLPEATAVLLTGRRLDREVSSALGSAQVTELLGQHPRVKERCLELRLDEFLPRLARFAQERVPGYLRWRKLRQEILERERHRLRLEEYKPRVLTSFVRNRLIDEVYLPLIGNNLAKQVGALGEGKRTDLMGMLLLISPPGYGKTTLMEYVANRLGLVFMKINGPALGHSVHSLDPAEAPNATAKQELVKLNLGLEMGNNVMLYVDDIQHTHPEFLQKFISLCDGQRRIEGVWKGRTRTYDMRGKKFCVVMAGNPYTESGEAFKIPDMLANRADTYNLGDILNGREDLFALSYLENTLTSNAALAPLALRDPADLHKLIRLSRGEEVALHELSHPYAPIEVQEILAVLRHLSRCQEVLLKVNLEYIRSAGQDDAYRVEPPFKLQGSYRNMNKLAEKVASAMNDAELEALVDDHYQGEAQTLTVGAEQNLLKLAELRGRMTDAQRARWDEIKKGYRRIQAAGGREEDPATRVVQQLSGLNLQLENIQAALQQGSGVSSQLAALREALDPRPMHGELAKLRASLEGSPLAPRLSEIQAALERANPSVELAALRQSLAHSGVAEALASLERGVTEAAKQANARNGVEAQASMIAHHLRKLAETTAALAESRLQAPPAQEQPAELAKVIAQQAELVEWTLVPLVRTMAQDLQGNREIWDRLGEILAHLKGHSAYSAQRVGPPGERSVFAVAAPQPSGEYPARPQPSAAPPTMPAIPAVEPAQGPGARGAFQAAPAKRRFSGASGAVPGQVGQGEAVGVAPASKPRVSEKAKARAQEGPQRAQEGPQRAQEGPPPVSLDALDQGWDEAGESPTLRLPAVKGPQE